MTRIISTTHVQQKIGQVSESIAETPYIVTHRGEGNIVMLPYFDGCDDQIMEYMEDYEMARNRDALKKRYKASSDSCRSNLVI